MKNWAGGALQVPISLVWVPVGCREVVNRWWVDGPTAGSVITVADPLCGSVPRTVAPEWMHAIERVDALGSQFSCSAMSHSVRGFRVDRMLWKMEALLPGVAPGPPEGVPAKLLTRLHLI